MGTQRHLHEPLPERARWEDLEAFQLIYQGVQNKQTIEQVGRSLRGTSGARMLYRRLARLEKALETQLVFRQRWSRETRITAAGKKLYHQLEHIMVLKRKLEEEIRSERPVFHIATSESIAFHVMAKVLAGRSDADTLPFELHFEEGNDWQDAIALLRRGEADMALLNVPTWVVPFEDLRTITIGTPHPWPLIVHPRHRFAERYRRGHHQPVKLTELKKENVAIHEMYREMFAPGKLSRSVMVIPRLASSPPLVRQGVAISPWCEGLARLSPLSDVITLPMESSLSCVSVMVFAPHFPRHSPEPMKSFLEQVETVFAQSVAHSHHH